jgi:hydroxymethylbilane synthase
LKNGDLDAVILAAAGLKRLGLADRITEYLDKDIMLPAVGQGALCIETRDDASDIASLVEPLNHPATRRSVMGERAFLHHLEGSCQVPVAAYGHIADQHFNLQGLVADIEGTTIIRDTRSGSVASAEAIGIDLAGHLLSRGADEILKNLKSDFSP